MTAHHLDLPPEPPDARVHHNKFRPTAARYHGQVGFGRVRGTLRKKRATPSPTLAGA